VRVDVAPKEHFSWLVERTKCATTEGFRAIEAFDDRGIQGMVGFDYWTPNAVQMHVAASPAAVRSLLWPAFHYAFEQAGRGLAIGITPASNERACAFNRRCGWREAYRIKDGWTVGEDMIVFEMRRNECRFLTPEWQKEMNRE
jgi:hypothetical protein